MARELPRGTVTFLFTDIEDSTRHMYIARSEGGTFKGAKNLGHIDPKACEVGRT
jgi:hypothetical protein